MGLKPKKCFVCGRIFVPKVNNQICCSKECRLQYREGINKLCWRSPDGNLVNAEIDDFLGDDIFIADTKLRGKPQLSDKIRVKKLLSDFGINSEIPDFATFQELDSWRKDKLGIIGH